MEKRKKMRICNLALLAVTLPMLASAIQMEASAGGDFLGMGFEQYMWLHVTLSIVTCALVCRHLWLHFGWKNWAVRIRRSPKRPVKILSMACILLTLSGALCLGELLLKGYAHTPVGGVHGKIGLVFLAFVIAHTIKRRNRLF